MVSLFARHLFLKFLGLTLVLSLGLTGGILALYYPYRTGTLVSEMAAVMGVVASKIDAPLSQHVAAGDTGAARQLLGLFGAFTYTVCVDYRRDAASPVVSWPIPCERLQQRAGEDLHLPTARTGGAFTIRLSRDEIDAILLREFTVLGGLGLGTAAAFLLAVAGIFQLVVNRPLSRMVRAMARFAADEVPERVTWPARDEIGQVVSGYNVLLDTVVARSAERDAEHARTLEVAGELRATLDRLRQTQTDLIEAEKMASLGGLVAGIAHEINTPVGVGVTAISHLRSRTREVLAAIAGGTLKKKDLDAYMATADQSTEIIAANLTRASDLIRSFKQVAVDQSSLEVREVGLLDYADEVLLSLRPHLKRTSHTVVVEGDRDLRLATHPGALSQVLTNLVMNSLIHAYEPDGPPGTLRIAVERDGDRVVLTYSDDGKGMDEATRSRIFEPFFTTRRGDGGSGLGMHIVYNQVTGTLGGTIACDSEPGRGTRFVITLPCQREAQHGR